MTERAIGLLDQSRVFRLLGHFADKTVGVAGRVFGVDHSGAKAKTNYTLAATADEMLTPKETAITMGGFLMGSTPRLVARFGSTEFRVVLRAHGRRTRSSFEKSYAAISRLEAPFWTKREHRRIQTHSGFYPISRQTIEDFVDVMINSMGEIDLLGSWVPGENQLQEYFSSAKVTSLGALSPFGKEQPWTKFLAGKRVLVIHPFRDTILSQYEKRERLFTDPGFMPDFDLRVVKAVQSLGSPPPEHETWFDGLRYMHDQSHQHEFDVALIACGAYGFPLGALMKRDGKKAFVVGGLLQLLFGIKGKRWDDSGLYNSHWVRPSESEKPDGFFGADGGAYW